VAPLWIISKHATNVLMELSKCCVFSGKELYAVMEMPREITGTLKRGLQIGACVSKQFSLLFIKNAKFWSHSLVLISLVR
jgi:hypothetical protein